MTQETDPKENKKTEMKPPSSPTTEQKAVATQDTEKKSQPSTLQPIPKTPSKTWLRTVGFLSWVAYNYNRLAVHGIENIPPKGEGALLCANHPGLLDPAYIHLAVLKKTERWMRWLGWAGLSKSSNKFIKWVVDNIGTMVPIEEHEGKAASKDSASKAIAILSQELQANHIVGMFPEGLNHKFGDYDEPYKFRTGAVRIAAQNGVPIIPTGIYGPHRVWMSFGEIKTKKFHMWITIPFWFPAKVHVSFGKPFVLDQKLYENPDDYALICAETERLKEHIYKLAHGLDKKRR